MATADELLDHTPLLFGKHKGKTPDQISDIDPGWLMWAYENIHDKRICSKVLYEACRLDSGEHDDDDRQHDEFNDKNLEKS